LCSNYFAGIKTQARRIYLQLLNLLKKSGVASCRALWSHGCVAHLCHTKQMNILVAPCFSGGTAKHKLAKQALERLQEDCIITNDLFGFC
jgi:hemolysin-activating ACP:hemolysin acyltransferase